MISFCVGAGRIALPGVMVIVPLVGLLWYAELALKLLPLSLHCARKVFSS